MKKHDIMPIAMPCSEEQFNDIKPKLIKAGIKISYISDFDACCYLTNNLHGRLGVISNIWPHGIRDNKRIEFFEWDEPEFLKHCGVVEEAPTDNVAPAYTVVRYPDELIEQLLSLKETAKKLNLSITITGSEITIKDN